MTLTIETCPFEELYQHPDFRLWVDQYVEECRNDKIAVPDFYVEKYREKESAGILRTLIAKDGSHLAGAAWLLVTPAAHYDFPLVSVDGFYLRKPWRKGFNGVNFLQAAKAVAIREGSKGLVFMAPPGSKLDRLCSVLGMVNTHKAYWCAV